MNRRILARKYRVNAALRADDAGSEYRAEVLADPARQVAIKVLRPGFSAAQIDAAQRAVLAAGQLDAPSVTTTHEVGKSGDVHFIAMELADCGGLDEHVGVGSADGSIPKGKLSLDEIRSFATDAAKGLLQAERAALPHGRICPANLRFTDRRELRVVGFDEARLLPISHPVVPTHVHAAAYASPERWRSALGDYRADMYALGATIFAMIVGYPAPFGASGMCFERLREFAEQQTFLSPRLVDPSVPEALDEVVRTMTARAPEARYASFADVVRALGGEPSASPARTAEDIVPRALTNQDTRIANVPHDGAAKGGSRAPGVVVGQTLNGNWRVDGMIGRGGMGTVYKGWQESMQRVVAIKTIKSIDSSSTRNKEALERFKQEALSAGGIDSPYITTVYEFGTSESGVNFIAMEFVPGGSLERYVNDSMDRERGSGLPPNQVAQIGYEAALGLLAVENAPKPIVHRDIKPGNLLFTSTDEQSRKIKIADFGAAKVLTQGGVGGVTKMGGGAPMSPLYASPEQWVGEDVDHRSDIYSLGATLFAVLVGRSATTLDKPRREYEILKFVQSTPFLSPKQHDPKVPEELDAIIRKMTASDLEERYQSFQEVVDAFEEVRQRRRRSLVTTLAVVAVLVLSAALVVTAYARGRDELKTTPEIATQLLGQLDPVDAKLEVARDLLGQVDRVSDAIQQSVSALAAGNVPSSILQKQCSDLRETLDGAITVMNAGVALRPRLGRWRDGGADGPDPKSDAVRDARAQVVEATASFGTVDRQARNPASLAKKLVEQRVFALGNRVFLEHIGPAEFAVLAWEIRELIATLEGEPALLSTSTDGDDVFEKDLAKHEKSCRDRSIRRLQGMVEASERRIADVARSPRDLGSALRRYASSAAKTARAGPVATIIEIMVLRDARRLFAGRAAVELAARIASPVFDFLTDLERAPLGFGDGAPAPPQIPPHWEGGEDGARAWELWKALGAEIYRVPSGLMPARHAGHDVWVFRGDSPAAGRRDAFMVLFVTADQAFLLDVDHVTLDEFQLWMKVNRESEYLDWRRLVARHGGDGAGGRDAIAFAVSGDCAIGYARSVELSVPTEDQLRVALERGFADEARSGPRVEEILQYGDVPPVRGQLSWDLTIDGVRGLQTEVFDLCVGGDRDLRLLGAGSFKPETVVRRAKNAPTELADLYRADELLKAKGLNLRSRLPSVGFRCVYNLERLP